MHAPRFTQSGAEQNDDLAKITTRTPLVPLGVVAGRGVDEIELLRQDHCKARESPPVTTGAMETAGLVRPASRHNTCLPSLVEMGTVSKC